MAQKKTDTSENTLENATPPKFTIERLRRDCLSIFGITSSTFDGATYGLEGEYSVEEMRGHIKEWQNKRVVPENAKVGE